MEPVMWRSMRAMIAMMRMVVRRKIHHKPMID
jgi:hypothetical protein